MTRPFDGHPLGDATRAFLANTHRLLIDGDRVDGIDGETLEMRSPASRLAARPTSTARLPRHAARSMGPGRAWPKAVTVRL